MQFSTAIIALFVASAVAVPTGGDRNTCNFEQDNEVKQGNFVCCTGAKSLKAAPGTAQSNKGLINLLNLNAGIEDVASQLTCVIGLCGLQALNNVGNDQICCQNTHNSGHRGGSFLDLTVIDNSCGSIL